MNRKEIEKMVSLADDGYIEEMFTARLYERKRHGTAWIAAAAAIAVAVGAAAVAVNTSDSNKITADLHDLITETETDTSAIESTAASQETLFSWGVLINKKGYFKNKPDDEAEYYYDLLERNLDFTTDGPVYRFTPEYLEEITRFTPEYLETPFRFERRNFLNIEGGLQCAENNVPLYAGIRLYNSDTDNLPMVHMVFYSDGSPFAGFDKSRYTSEIYGDTALYGFDLSEEKDGSKLLACWRSGDTNYMFASRDLGVDNFLEVISMYTNYFRQGDNNLMYVEDDFTLDSFDLNSGAVRTVSSYKGASEMNRDSVFAGYVPDGSPFAGLSLYGTPQDQNYEEANIGGETIYKRYRQLLVDPESYEIGNGSEKIYISLIYEWDAQNTMTDSRSNYPVVPLEEITPEKLDEIRTDEDNREKYYFVIPVNDFTITVLASCEREQLLEAMDAIRSQGGSVTRLSLAEANSETPFAGYIPLSDSIEGLDLAGVIKDTSKREELRVMYRGENKLRETEYVHCYYINGLRRLTDSSGQPLPVVESPEELSVQKLEEVKKLGSGDLTKHSFYLNINEAGFCIRVEALCSSEKLMKFFGDMPNLIGVHYGDGLNEAGVATVTLNENPGEESADNSVPNESGSETAVTTVVQDINSGTETTAGESADKDTVMYEGRAYYRSMLSEETLEWLDWYNSLSEEERLAVSYEPEELSYLQYRF